MGGFDENDKDGKEEDSPKVVSEPKKAEANEEEADAPSGMSRKMSETSICATEEEDDEDGRKIELGPQYTLKELNEKDKVLSRFSPIFYLSFFINFFNLFLLPFSALCFRMMKVSGGGRNSFWVVLILNLLEVRTLSIFLQIPFVFLGFNFISVSHFQIRN